MQNKLKMIIRRILQNSHLNREKFVINKRLYNNQKKPVQIIMKRQFGTYTPPNSNKNPNPFSNIVFVVITGFITGTCLRRNN